MCPAFANSVDPDQLASEEANWSGSALFVIQYVNLYQQSGSSNLICWQLEVRVFCLCWGFTAQSTQWGHVERGQFT